MWKYTFVNAYGVTFTYTTGESEDKFLSDLAYIKYCLDRNSILVKMQPV